MSAAGAHRKLNTQGEVIMVRDIKTVLALAALAFTFGVSVYAQDSMKHEEKAKTLATGSFHGKVHGTSGRATIYQKADENANFLKSSTERVELGILKGNEGDQNYEIPSGTDLSKFQTVSIYCERFNANFGAAPLEKF